MIEEGKCCSDVMTKYFSKELTMAKKDDEDIEKYTKCQVCDNDYIDGKVRVKDHFHITGKYRGSGHKNVSNDDFKYLSQEIHNKVLHLVKQNGFYPFK